MGGGVSWIEKYWKSLQLFFYCYLGSNRPLPPSTTTAPSFISLLFFLLSVWQVRQERRKEKAWVFVSIYSCNFTLKAMDIKNQNVVEMVKNYSDLSECGRDPVGLALHPVGEHLPLPLHRHLTPLLHRVRRGQQLLHRPDTTEPVVFNVF
jgi:hypothetical protein